MKYILSLIILLGVFGWIHAFATFAAPTFSVHNGQVYLDWGTSCYSCTYTVLRSTLKGGYYEVIADKLEESKYVDTPKETEKTYYYVISRHDRDSDVEEERSKEIGVYVP